MAEYSRAFLQNKELFRKMAENPNIGLALPKPPALSNKELYKLVKRKLKSRAKRRLLPGLNIKPLDLVYTKAVLEKRIPPSAYFSPTNAASVLTRRGQERVKYSITHHQATREGDRYRPIVTEVEKLGYVPPKRHPVTKAIAYDSLYRSIYEPTDRQLNIASALSVGHRSVSTISEVLGYDRRNVTSDLTGLGRIFGVDYRPRSADFFRAIRENLMNSGLIVFITGDNPNYQPSPARPHPVRPLLKLVHEIRGLN